MYVYNVQYETFKNRKKLFQKDMLQKQKIYAQIKLT